jgi:hypothetical protein
MDYSHVPVLDYLQMQRTVDQARALLFFHTVLNIIVKTNPDILNLQYWVSFYFFLQTMNIELPNSILSLKWLSAAYEASYGAVYPSSHKLAESKHADVQESARCRYAVNLGRLSRPLRK